MKLSSKVAAPIGGTTASTRLPRGAGSTASGRLAVFTAPLHPLRQVGPGRGRMAAAEPKSTTTPLPRRERIGGLARTAWRIDSTG